MARFRVLALGAVVAAACGGGEPIRTATLSGRLVFVSDRGGDHQLYATDPDGSGVVRLTEGLDRPDDPAVSPDGSRVAFTAVPPGADRPDIFVMDVAGGTPVQLSPGTPDQNPAWSPDGQSIAFDRFEDGSYDLYVMNAVGTQVRRLTDSLADDGEPAWSPDGRRIAFTSDRRGDPDIYVMDAHGSAVTRLTGGPDAELFPAWSPDGSSIAFVRGDPGDIWIMRSDGSGAAPLAPHPADDKDPAWSPDGAAVAFESTREGARRTDIFVLAPDGSRLRRLTSPDADDEDPAWGPM